MRHFVTPYLRQVCAYVTQSIIDPSSSPSNVLQGVKVYRPMQDRFAEEPPHLQIRKLKVGQEWGDPLNLLGQTVQVPPGLQESESLSGLGKGTLKSPLPARLGVLKLEL